MKTFPAYEAWMQGYHAGTDGLPVTANPFWTLHPFRTPWNDGHKTACADRRHRAATPDKWDHLAQFDQEQLAARKSGGAP